MREIKFRQFIGGKMVYWGFIDGAFFSPSANGATSENAQNTPHMQYTGLHDKNGKEIYEGDLICSGQSWPNSKDPDDPREGAGNYVYQEHFEIVLFVNGFFGVYDTLDIKGHEKYIATLAERMGKQQGAFASEQGVKVVGNIYENPNLLTT